MNPITIFKLSSETSDSSARLLFKLNTEAFEEIVAPVPATKSEY